MILEFFKGFLGFTSSIVKVPIVRADDDDDDEDDLLDPLVGIRASCSKDEKGFAYFKKLDECNTRVRSKKKTKEACEEEYHDFVHYVDNCAAKILFGYLK